VGFVTPAEVAAGYLAAFESADPDAIAGWVTEDFVNEHTAALGTGCVGRDAYRSRLPGFLATFSGLRYTVDEIVVEGQRAVAAYTMRAEFQGTPTHMRGVMRFVVRGDQIAQRIDYWDSLQFLLQVDPEIRTTLSAWLT
jgi:ketosteroid isomerase-like protein